MSKRVVSVLLMLSAFLAGFHTVSISETARKKTFESKNEERKEFIEEEKLFASSAEIRTNNINTLKSQLEQEWTNLNGETFDVSISVVDMQYEDASNEEAAGDTTEDEPEDGAESEQEAAGDEIEQSGTYKLTYEVTTDEYTKENEISILYDTNAPILVDYDGNEIAVITDKNYESEDVTDEPEIDVSGYAWCDETAIVSQDSEVECVDKEKHIWQVTLSAEDSCGNTKEMAYNINVVQKEEVTVEPDNEITETEVATANEESTQMYENMATWCNQVVDDTNALRSSLGLSTLERDSTLDQICYERAVDMIENNYFDHYKPGELGVQVAIVGYKYGIYTSLGENIEIVNIPDDGHMIYELWKESQEHYECMTLAQFNKMGVCILKCDSMPMVGVPGYVAVEVFGL